MRHLAEDKISDRSKDEMNCVLGVRVRHVSRLRRLGDLYITHPVLTDWANFCRTSGAVIRAE